MFKVLANMDGHLDDTSAASKQAFNYVFLCEDEEEEEVVLKSFEELNMIQRVEVILYISTSASLKPLYHKLSR